MTPRTPGTYVPEEEGGLSQSGRLAAALPLRDGRIAMALLSVGIVLYTLPHMHERYGFFLDILAIIYALQRPSKAPVALGYITVSLISYIFFLNQVHVISPVFLSLALLGLHTYVCMDLARQIKEQRIDLTAQQQIEG